ncbi:MAG: sel1 repeat family protein [Verrucomicrobia bacterium]|nr:sel1 repeat family protein [Verrucomicrobiota bacterium]
MAWLLPAVLAGKDNSQPCNSDQTGKKKSKYDLYGLLYFVLFPRGDKTPTSWVAEAVHRILLAWDRHQAERGSLSAAYELGRSTYFGLGTAPNETEGLKWLLKAAVQGDPLAQYTVAAIGFCRYSNDPLLAERAFTKKNYSSLPKDIRDHFTQQQCQTWLTEAAGRGYPKALRLRAFVPEKTGENEMQSLKTVLLWLEKAQIAGDPFAEGCRRELLGLKSTKSIFAFPDFIWTPWGTP